MAVGIIAGGMCEDGCQFTRKLLIYANGIETEMLLIAEIRNELEVVDHENFIKECEK